MAEEDDDLKATVETITAEVGTLDGRGTREGHPRAGRPAHGRSLRRSRATRAAARAADRGRDGPRGGGPTGLTERDYAERRSSWAIQPLSRSSRRRRWLSSYQDSVARFIALGLTSGPAGDDRRAYRRADEHRRDLRGDDVRRFAGQSGGGLDATGAGERFEHERVGVLRREEARPREQERVGCLGCAQAVPKVRPEGDLAPVEPAQRKTEAKAFGEQWKVVGCGRLVHGGGGSFRLRGQARPIVIGPYGPRVAMRSGER